MPLSRASLVGVVACASLLVSCDSEPKSTIPEYCDPIVPEFCAYPFPSNLWLVPDPSMPSGKRGLANMRQRAKNLGADIEIGPHPEGWSVRLSFAAPLPAREQVRQDAA